MKELLKANAKEWHYILLGILGSIIEGSAFPVFAILFGQVLRVCLSVLPTCSVMVAGLLHTHTDSSRCSASGVRLVRPTERSWPMDRYPCCTWTNQCCGHLLQGVLALPTFAFRLKCTIHMLLSVSPTCRPSSLR